MCGIAGFVLRNRNADVSLLRTMCTLIRHRGPDDEGLLARENWAIGMRRLSIIDLVTGNQPMSNEDGSLWIVFNGEVYNFEALREHLSERGQRFRTRSDTEAVLYIYQHYGVEGFTRLRGMFAAAIWDGRNRRMILVRDRFGKKPLYWCVRDSGLYFASELKCLREACAPLELDEQAIRLYLQFSYIPDPLTPIRGIQKLTPGSWLAFDEGGSVRTGRYWTLPAPAEHASPGFTEQEACALVRETFDESVRLRMIADVPLGAFLSGGIDSSLVVASMARQSQAPVKTFSIGFEEAAFNELPYARLVAEQYKTEHHEIVVRPDAVSLVERLVRHFDEPFGDSSAIPTYLVSEFAARHVKVALSGDGGDELFGGYQSFFAVDRLRRFDAAPQALRRIVSGIAESLPYSAYGKNYLRMISRSSPLERYFELNYAPYFLRRQLLEPHWMLPSNEHFFRTTFSACLPANGADILTQVLYFEATANLTGDMLVKVDRMSMANSLEVRAPMLDHELAAVTARIPHAWKIHGGRGKQILIKALGDRLPPALLDRPKQGFAVPLPIWFRGPLRPMLGDMLGGKQFLERGIVRPAFVRTLLDEHASGRRDNSHWLWRLLMLELWLREWKEVGVPAGAAPVGVSG
ncbi:MAG TPA: asparagine synthase (glutamine-hydrolyzing) [Bryobacteraceae bacterium]|nr:asparagine synthase (glutamine-hydrolyzing) [Bryobacteraceae bacterium]